jgi:2'-5' RNA ligase
MADRLFLGVPLSAEATEQLSAELAKVFPHGLPGRPVPPANWHLTLRFLGDTSAEVAARVRGEVAAGGLGLPFGITLGELGAFPRPEHAAVVWIGVSEGEEALIRLAEAVEGRVRRAGVQSETRAFSPHLTLARLRHPANLSKALSLAVPPRIPHLVGEVVLFRSHLGAGEPRYEVVERFPL